MFFHCLLIQRFVSKRSSSSVDLAPSSASSSLDDVRAERAAIALSVGLSWPPVKRQRSAGRRSWQQLSERALHKHILHHHELLYGVPLTAAGLVATRRDHRSTVYRGDRRHQRSWPPQPPQPLHSLKTSPVAARQNSAKSTPTSECATGSSTCSTSGGQNGDGACSGACARSSGSAPGCLTRSARTSSAARQEDFATTRRHDTAQRAHHASD